MGQKTQLKYPCVLFSPGNNGADYSIEEDDFFVDPTESEKIRALLKNLADILPHRFTCDDVPDMPAHTKQFSKVVDKAILILKPRLNGSWFIPSNKECDTDTIGCWPAETKFSSEKMPTKSPKTPQSFLEA